MNLSTITNQIQETNSPFISLVDNDNVICVQHFSSMFDNENITILTGDKESMGYKEILFKELSTIIYEDGKVISVGDHDDTVMSLWIAIQAAIEYFGSILL